MIHFSVLGRGESVKVLLVLALRNGPRRVLVLVGYGYRMRI